MNGRKRGSAGPRPVCDTTARWVAIRGRGRRSDGVAEVPGGERGWPHDGGKADPYLSVKGVRDIASGLIAVILLAARMPHVLGWFELAASTIPIGDAIIVLRSNGPKATVYGVQGATAVVLLGTAALLFTGLRS